jgi:predicted SprT family Zn-dependent metalloprotease
VSITITQAQYEAFQRAYDFFNGELFAGALPNVLVTLQRHAKTYGYFSPERFVGRADQAVTHELAMNPDHFGRLDEEILSTLVHEMCHLWQHVHGTPPRKSYHDKEWAAKMKEVGLFPSSTAAPGGKETGQKVSHYVVASGPFSQACARLQATGFELRWQSRADDPQQKAKTASKTKYTCPECNQNAWAKPGAALICGVCYEEDGQICAMEEAEA